MVAKTSGNTLKWDEHDLVLANKSNLQIRGGNTFNLLGGGLPLNQIFALFLDVENGRVSVTVTEHTSTQNLYDYSIAPMKQALNPNQIGRLTGTGLEDVEIFTVLETLGGAGLLNDAGGIDNDDESFTVDSGHGLAIGDAILLDNEHMVITNVQTNLITAPRIAVSPVAHVDNTRIFKIVALPTSYTGTEPKIYKIVISAAATPDTFTYATSTDGGATYNSPSSSIAITGAPQILAEGLTIKFANTTGHINSDAWIFQTPMPPSVEVAKQTVGSGEILTTAISGKVTAAHRQVFAVKIIAGGGSQNTFKYSTDGGVTFDNGGGSTDGSGNLNIPGSPYTHTLRQSDNSSYGITITFSGTTGYTTNDEFRFHAFPATTFDIFRQTSNKVLIGTVQNIGETDRLKTVITAQDQIVRSSNIVDDSLTASLMKKGVQSWATNIRFEGTDWQTVRYYKGQNDDGSAVGNTTTDATISFADGTTETITAASGLGLVASKTSYIYKNVGDSASPNLQVAFDYGDLYQDDRVLLAIVVLAASDDGTDSPSIFPFNGQQSTISAGIIAANVITADTIQANAITAKHTITGATIQTATSGARVRLAGANIDSFANTNTWDFTGGLRFYDGNNETLGVQMKANYFPGLIPGNSSGRFFLILSGDIILYPNSGAVGQLSPYGNNLVDLGQTSTRFRDLWISRNITYAGSLANTSDERIKTNITDFGNADALTFINSLTPRKFNKHGTDILQYGLVAQEIETVLTGLSIDKTKLGMIKIPATETYPDKKQIGVNDDGSPIEEAITSMDLRTLDYTQFIAPLIGAIKELKRRLEILESA